MRWYECQRIIEKVKRKCDLCRCIPVLAFHFQNYYLKSCFLHSRWNKFVSIFVFVCFFHFVENLIEILWQFPVFLSTIFFHSFYSIAIKHFAVPHPYQSLINDGLFSPLELIQFCFTHFANRKDKFQSGMTLLIAKQFNLLSWFISSCCTHFDCDVFCVINWVIHFVSIPDFIKIKYLQIWQNLKTFS